MASKSHSLSVAEGDTSQDSFSKTPNEKGSLEDDLVQDEVPDDAFPEGGARAWSVAIGTAAVAFCTMGYINSFGSVTSFIVDTVCQVLKV
jgi:hypothetical protein